MEIISTNEVAKKCEALEIRDAMLCDEKEINGDIMASSMWNIIKKTMDTSTEKYNQKEKIKPFVKWAGGKGQLLNNIREIYPKNLGSKITKYAEPFVGGGAILFDILTNYELDSIYISDINEELINTYITIRENVDNLILLLEKYQTEYIPLDTENRKFYYYNKRKKFNELKFTKLDNNIEKSALFIFLNKTCFNGLYRVNKNGQFNVPMGAYRNPLICDGENLRRISKKLEKVKIVCGDYRKSEDFIDNRTFVYFDPPYRPLNETSSFTSYTENIFDDTSQIELAEFIKKLDIKGAKIALSNSDPKNINKDDDFFDNLYKNQNIKRIEANRMINSKASLRGKIKELLITNY